MARGGAALLALLMRGARPQYTVDDLKYDEVNPGAMQHRRIAKHALSSDAVSTDARATV